MGELKGQMGTVLWQLGVLLALGLGGGGSVGSFNRTISSP